MRYIRLLYKNDPIRSLFEFALALFALHYFLSSKRKENKAEIVSFLDREIDEMVAEWEPELLSPPLPDLQKWQPKSIPQIVGINASHVSLEGHNTRVVNLASNDFLCLNLSPETHKVAKDAIRAAGVGACGPPNFYGTQDMHVRLEEDVARFLDTDQAILYGQDFVTAGSVIPAFLKRGDLCVVDSGVNLAIQKALIVSRCDIEWFDHNDMEHLESILEEIKPVLAKQKPLRRRFIVTEGLFANSGDLAPLPQIVELKNRYKYRVFLDETYSIGVLGNTGKGLAQHFGVPRDEVAITIGSFALSFASSGGFCAGVKPMIHHQRIQSSAYVFSASLPPYSAKVASHTIREISDGLLASGKSALLVSLMERVTFLHSKLAQLLAQNPYMDIVSCPKSPILHLRFSPEYREQLQFPAVYGSLQFLNTGKPAKLANGFDANYNAELFMLQKIIDRVLERAHILLTRSKLVLEHENLPVEGPHLLIHVNTNVSLQELTLLADTLLPLIKEVCGNVTTPRHVSNLSSEMLAY